MSILQAAGLTLLPHLGGLAGGLATRHDVKTWYNKIDKPDWSPLHSKWLYGPVWTGLYTAMGYSSFLILRDGVGDKRDLALGLYASQLALNWAWPQIFFKYRKLGLATAENLLLLGNIGACIYTFYPINKNAAYLLIPYFAWVAFANLVSFNIWQRNKGRRFDFD